MADESAVVAEPDTQPDPEPVTDTGDLGDAGKRALEAERKAARAAERRAKDLERRLAEIDRRVVAAEVKAAAAGVLQDPDDAVSMLDLDQFGVDDDGNVDLKAIKAEIAALAKAKPYLSVGAKPAPLPAGGATPSSGPSMDDALRAAVRAKRL